MSYPVQGKQTPEMHTFKVLTCAKQPDITQDFLT